MDKKIKRMKELIEILNNASRLYYQFSTSIMTDYEYDKLYDELVLLEKETNMTLSNSPTIHVETEIISSLEQFEHPSPMLSLSKTKSTDELADFIGDLEGILSWKLDGLTIVLTYNDGKLVRGVTRGNGIVGEVITENVKQFKNIPLTIPYKKELVVRGEAVIKYSDFNKMNDEIEDADLQYKNPRNLCSGSVRQLDPSITAKRNVNCIIFSLISNDLEIPKYIDQQYDFLESLGFEVVDHVKVTNKNIKEEVLKYKEKIKKYDVPSDGLVLAINDIIYGQSLGNTAKYPRHSIAFKWQDETKDTILREVYWSPSRTGLINPVAIFDPISLEGTNVQRASLHNLSILEALKIGIGDCIQVYKANMIIPQIANNLTKSGNLKYPTKCPICNHDTTIEIINDIKYLTCKNPLCRAKLMKKLSLFTSRNAMDIEGISDAILTKLIDEEIVTTYLDLFHLKDYKEKIINFEGFGEKSYLNIMNSVNKSRKVKLSNFIYALGIPEIGLSRAKLICNHFDNNYDLCINATYEELEQIEGVGKIIALEWTTYFNNKDNRDMLNYLIKEIEFINYQNNNVFKNKNFVITGSLNTYSNRDELINIIENNGGKVLKAISKNVDYLINNDINSSSSKNRDAKALNIPIITEEEFNRKLNGDENEI